MATASLQLVATGNRLVRNERWDLAQGDDGEAARFAIYTDRSVHVSGTFGGASVAIEGSNNGGATWVTLTDPQGLPLAFNTPGLKQITEATMLLRPRVTGGDGTTAIQVNTCSKEPA